jgi:RecA-family ATPase
LSDAGLASSTQESLLANARSMVERLEARQVADGSIRSAADIPNIFTLDIPEPEYLVEGLIARGTLTEWTGLGGAAKSYLLQKMCIAIAQGTEFLGMKCRRANVLYLDYENPGFVVKNRLNLMAGTVLHNIHVWGKWLSQPAPPIGHATLKRLVKELQPLALVIDPLRDAHSGDENDSGEMKAVMDHLRTYTSLETAVLASHHVARYDGSMSRGSTAIYDAMDVALLQKQDEETGQITLKICKHRWAEPRSITLKVDFKTGRVEVLDNPKAAQETEELTTLYRIIQMTPGISQNQLVAASGMRKQRACELLGRNIDVLWHVQKEGQKLCYYPHSAAQ